MIWAVVVSFTYCVLMWGLGLWSAFVFISSCWVRLQVFVQL